MTKDKTKVQMDTGENIHIEHGYFSYKQTEDNINWRLVYMYR